MNKSLIKIISLLCFQLSIIPQARGQLPTSERIKSLSIGNIYYFRNFDSGTYFENKEIVTDTSINGKVYAIIRILGLGEEQHQIYDRIRYERADSTRLYYLYPESDEEFVAADFNWNVGEIVRNGCRVYQNEQSIFFDQDLTKLYFGRSDELSSSGFTYHSFFGLTRHKWSADFTLGGSILIGAVIDGICYGDCNDPPVVTSISDSVADEKLFFYSDINVTDPDIDDKICFELNRQPDWLYVSSYAQLYGTPTVPGEFEFDLVAKDIRGGEDMKTFTIAVQANHDPVITSTPVTSAFPDETYTYQAVAMENDPEQLTYSLEMSPEWLSIDANSGLVSGTPSSKDKGFYPVSLRVTDHRGGSDLQSFEILVITKFFLFQNYPNPFNRSTTFYFALPQNDVVTLELFSITGQSIAVIKDKEYQKGDHRFLYQPQKLASGQYIYRLKTKNGFSQTRKLVILN